jgi:O-antigen ligase
MPSFITLIIAFRGQAVILPAFSFSLRFVALSAFFSLFVLVGAVLSDFFFCESLDMVFELLWVEKMIERFLRFGNLKDQKRSLSQSVFGSLILLKFDPTKFPV